MSEQVSSELKLYGQLFWTFAKIGTFTLGGGYAMIPLIQHEVVTKRHWLKDEEFMNMLVLAQAAPGVIAVNASIFIGYKIRGWKGMLVTSLGSILPSFTIILMIAACFMRFKDLPQVEAVFKGIRPAVVALIAAPLFKMAKAAKISWLTAIIPIGVTLIIWLGNFSPVWVIMITIATSLLFVFMKQRRTK